MPAEAVTESLRRVWQILDEAQVPAALMGGIALSLWKRVRSTQDVDLLIGLAGTRPHALLSRLKEAGFRAKGRQAIVRLEDAEFIQLIYEPPGTFLEIQVDLLLADTDFQKQALSRRVLVHHEELGGDYFVLSCEDLIVMKLEAGRIIDIVDAAALLHENREHIDMSYLTQWIAKRRLQRQFDEASREAARLDSLP